jgi:PIN domain nuclease of toxin-antitoxin system
MGDGLDQLDQLGSPLYNALLNDPSNDVAFSAASAWEIAIKWRIGRLTLADSPERYIPLQLLRQGISSLEVTVRHAVATADLPPHHGDPFDRLLMAQARCDGLTLVTADATLAQYPVALLRV